MKTFEYVGPAIVRHHADPVSRPQRLVMSLPAALTLTLDPEATELLLIWIDRERLLPPFED